MENTTINQQMSNEIVQIAEKDKVYFEFENISCILHRFNFNKLRFEKKEVLKGVSGCFKSGELTGIIGPSGAGKTTLLNILAGYSTTGAKGTITINGVSVSASQSSNRGGTKYIRQQDDLRPYLTVYETMYFAAALKLVNLTSQERHIKVIEILRDLNICESQETLARCLSGGEKRRLAVSLELLSDPPLMFLDEPTTGLDSVASTSLVALLSKLAKGGRTIVATIQQPSAMLLEKMDVVYCVANGKTLYDGPQRNLIPAFNHAELNCPSNYNPADFLIEIASLESQSNIDKAAAGMLQYNLDSAIKNHNFSTKKFKGEKDKVWKVRHEANRFIQTYVLIRRTYVIAARNYLYFLFRAIAHMLVGFLIGKVYYMAGSDASTLIGNASAIFSCEIFVIYAALMYIMLLSQLEIEIVKGEHFNQWYKLGPYMISFLAAELPFQALMTTMCASICYWLTGNPIEFDRITLYLAAMLLVTICAQSFGFFLGSTLPLTAAVFVGPTITCVGSIFAYSLPLKYTPYPFRWLSHTSYFRAGAHLATAAIYENRKKIHCSKEYCHFMSPKDFLIEFDLAPISITNNVLLIVGTTVMMFAFTYCILYWRLNKK